MTITPDAARRSILTAFALCALLGFGTHVAAAQVTREDAADSGIQAISRVAPAISAGISCGDCASSNATTGRSGHLARLDPSRGRVRTSAPASRHGAGSQAPFNAQGVPASTASDDDAGAWGVAMLPRSRAPTVLDVVNRPIAYLQHLPDTHRARPRVPRGPPSSPALV
jgi:hypothetical protein